MPDTSSLPVSYKSSQTEHTLALPSQQLRYTAIAEWQPLFEKELPIAQMFHVAYLAQTDVALPLPLTFIFNGWPGAASAYLHMGALGPKRVYFGERGSLPSPPVPIGSIKTKSVKLNQLSAFSTTCTGGEGKLPRSPK